MLLLLYSSSSSFFFAIVLRNHQFIPFIIWTFSLSSCIQCHTHLSLSLCRIYMQLRHVQVYIVGLVEDITHGFEVQPWNGYLPSHYNTTHYCIIDCRVYRGLGVKLQGCMDCTSFYLVQFLILTLGCNSAVIGVLNVLFRTGHLYHYCILVFMYCRFSYSRLGGQSMMKIRQ